MRESNNNEKSDSPVRVCYKDWEVTKVVWCSQRSHSRPTSLSSFRGSKCANKRQIAEQVLGWENGWGQVESDELSSQCNSRDRLTHTCGWKWIEKLLTRCLGLIWNPASTPLVIWKLILFPFFSIFRMPQHFALITFYINYVKPHFSKCQKNQLDSVLFTIL